MIGVYIIEGIIALIGIGSAIFLGYKAIEEESPLYWVGVVLVIIITAAICASVVWFVNNTESGKRLIKDVKSEINGGIERTVEVYDIDGNLIKEYSGKFDVVHDSDRIKFDDENGKRHIIYYTTGTVIIDEK